MFVAALLTTAKRWIQRKHPPPDGWVCIESGILYSLKKGGDSDACYNVDEARGHTRWSTDVIKGQALYDCT